MKGLKPIALWSLLAVPLLVAAAVWVASISAAHHLEHLDFKRTGPALHAYQVVATPRGIHVEYSRHDGRGAKVLMKRSSGAPRVEGWSYERNQTVARVTDGFDIPEFWQGGGKLPGTLGEVWGCRIRLPWLTVFPLAATPLAAGVGWRWWCLRRRRRRMPAPVPVALHPSAGDPPPPLPVPSAQQ